MIPVIIIWMINFGIKYIYIYVIFFHAISTQPKLRRCCWIMDPFPQMWCSFLVKSTFKEVKSMSEVLVRSWWSDQLHKGVVCFMIIVLKSNVSHVIRSVPETNIQGEQLQGEILSSIIALENIGFNERGVICDNHPSNVSEFSNISARYGRGEDALRVWIKINQYISSMTPSTSSRTFAIIYLLGNSFSFLHTYARNCTTM